jgi:DNA-binding XRE family transcriptional regulator
VEGLLWSRGMPSRTTQLLLAKLKQLRLGRGWTQEEFSEKSGISYKYYQAVEAGRKKDLRQLLLPDAAPSNPKTAARGGKPGRSERRG